MVDRQEKKTISLSNDDTSSMENLPGVVLLGASNVRRSLPVLVDCVQSHFPNGWKLIVVAGHGRSYGSRTNVLGYQLPGIAEANWMRCVDELEVSRWYALVTDVGNDLLYGRDPIILLQWIECCLQKLRQKKASTILTGMPIESCEQLSQMRFLLLRTLFFPRSSMSLETITQRSQQVHSALHQLADRYAIAFPNLPKQWYGFDPIHIRFRDQREAWSRILAPWNDFAEKNFSLLRSNFFSSLRWKLHRSRAADQRFFFIDQSRAQPSIQLDSNRSIWFF